MKLKPLYDRVAIKPLKNPEKTIGGIILPAIAQEKSQIGEVVAIGTGGSLDGKQEKIQVKSGDKVLYSKFAGTEIKVDENEYIILRQTDVLAVLED